MNTKDDLHKELREIDSQVKASAQIQQLEDNFDLENLEGHEFDKRLGMYRKLREQLQGDISKISQQERNAQMEQLNKKIQDLEKAKKDREAREFLKS